MQNSLAGRDCSHGQDLVAAEHYRIHLKSFLATTLRASPLQWGEYKGSKSRPAGRCPRVVVNDIDNAIEALVDPKAFVAAAETDDSKLDKYKRWKRWEPRAEKGSEAANNTIKY
jgi:hypothetical protein